MTETPLRKSLAIRSGFSLLLQLALRLRGLLLVPFLTRALAPAELGVITLGNALTAGLAPLLLLGMHTGLSLQLVRLEGEAVRPALLSVLSFSAFFSVSVTVLSLATVSTGVFGEALAPILPVLFPVGVFAIGLAFREVAMGFPQVRQRLRFIGWMSLFIDFGGVILAIALVLKGLGAYGVLLGVGGMSLIGACFTAVYSLRQATGPWAFDGAFLKRTLKTALPVVPLAMSLWILQSADYLFVSHHRGAADVAIYGLAYNLASPTLMAIMALNLTYLPTCVEILQKGRVPFARFMDKSSVLFSIAGIAAIAFATSAGPGFSAWFAGPEYEESGRLLPLVVAGYVFFSLSQLQQFIPAAMTQKLGGAARANGWAAALNLGLNFLLVPLYGIWGAAWATAGSYAISFFLFSRSVRATLPELQWMSRSGRLLVLGALSIAIALFLQTHARSALDALLLGALASVGTTGLAFALGLLDRGDLRRALASRPFAA